MGKIVSIWSSTKKTGKTLFLYTLVNHLSKIIKKDITILTVCVNLNYGNLGSLLNIDGSELNLEELVNLKLHPDGGLNLLNSLARKNNIFFVGSKKTNNIYASRHIKVYEQLLEEFRQSFDIVLIDTISGHENSLTNMILEKSDHILNVINQDKESLDRCLFTMEKDLAYLINRYRDIYPDEKELASIYGLKNMFKLPSCDVLQEMKNKGKLEYYLQHETIYNKEVISLAAFLAGELGIEIQEQISNEKRKRRLFAGLLEGIM